MKRYVASTVFALVVATLGAQFMVTRELNMLGLSFTTFYVLMLLSGIWAMHGLVDNSDATLGCGLGGGMVCLLILVGLAIELGLACWVLIFLLDTLVLGVAIWLDIRRYPAVAQG